MDERRATFRSPLNPALAAQLFVPNSPAPILAAVQDVSRQGMALYLPRTVELPEVVILELMEGSAGLRRPRELRVVHAYPASDGGTVFGGAFLQAPSDAELRDLGVAT